MNFKKLMQAALVTLSCGLLNIAGAEQRVIHVPTDYAQQKAEASLTMTGPKLLFSDSPETVYDNGILYRDKVQGEVRLFLHHVNGVSGTTKKLAVLVKNKDSLRPVAYSITRRGEAGYSYDYLAAGKKAQKKYLLEDKQKPLESKLGFGRSAELLTGRGIAMPSDKLYTETIDMYFAKPVEFSVLMCEEKSDLELFNEAAPILPMDEHPLRGTFEGSDWNYKLKKAISKPSEALYLELASPSLPEGYAKGVDATTGLPAENYGNYGVLYNLDFTIKGKEPVTFIFNPIGGWFAGYGVLENKTKGERKLIGLPQNQISVGDPEDEALDLGLLHAGEYRFTWSPPGASNLPVQVIWIRPGELESSKRISK